MAAREIAVEARFSELTQDPSGDRSVRRRARQFRASRLDSAALCARADRAISEAAWLRHLAREWDIDSKIPTQRNALELVVHDLANSLAAAQLCAAALAQKKPGRAGRSRDHLSILRRCLTQMEGLLADLRDMRQMSLGRFIVDRGAPVSPTLLVATAIEAARPAAGERRLLAACATGLGHVLVDERRIQRVFANLIGNAVKFTDQGGAITVGAERGPPGQVRFFVRDDGGGIREADQLRIFDPYWQVDPNHRHGSGLGLTICKGIVEAHGGRIMVTSRPGAGSTFAFTLPCARERG